MPIMGRRDHAHAGKRRHRQSTERASPCGGSAASAGFSLIDNRGATVGDVVGASPTSRIMRWPGAVKVVQRRSRPPSRITRCRPTISCGTAARHSRDCAQPVAALDAASLDISGGVGQSYQKAPDTAADLRRCVRFPPPMQSPKGAGLPHHRRRSAGSSVPNVKYRG